MRRLLLLGLALLWAVPAWAALTLKQIQPLPHKQAAHLQLVFDGDLTTQPSFLFEKGILQLILPKVQFDPTLAQTRINDGFINQVTLTKEGESTLLTLQFADTGFQAQGMVRDSANFEVYHLLIYHQAADVPATPTPGAEPAAPAAAATPAAAPGSLAQDALTTDNLIKMLLALFVVLLVFYLLLLAYNRLFVQKLSLAKGKYRLRVTSNYHISPKQKISIVEVNDQAFAVGITPTQISVISKVSDDDFVNYLSKVHLKAQETIDFARLREEYLVDRAKREEPPAPASFTHEFIRKVKNLKPLD